MLKKFQVFNTLKQAENTVKWLNDKFSSKIGNDYEYEKTTYFIQGKKILENSYFSGCTGKVYLVDNCVNATEFKTREEALLAAEEYLSL